MHSIFCIVVLSNKAVDYSVKLLQYYKFIKKTFIAIFRIVKLRLLCCLVSVKFLIDFLLYICRNALLNLVNEIIKKINGKD